MTLADVRAAAEWLVEQTGFPIDITTIKPPPAPFRNAIYDVWEAREPDLTRAEIVAWVDWEAGW
jgi:hypothetical protein